MVAEITQTQNNSVYTAKAEKSANLPLNFAEKLNQQIQSSQSEFTEQTQAVESNARAQITLAKPHSIYFNLYGVEPQTPREELEMGAKWKMEQDLRALESDYYCKKYPYGSVFTTDDYGNIISGKIYKADGTFYEVDGSELPTNLTSKDLSSIIKVMSDEDLKNYCDSKDISAKSFVELLQKYDKEGKFDEKIRKKLEILPEQFKAYVEAAQARAAKEAKEKWFSFLLPDNEKPYQTAYNQLKGYLAQVG